MSTYKFRTGFSCGVAPQTAGESLEATRQSNGGLLRPRDVVHDAKPVSAALHPAFEWNNQKAASLYREDQARGIIRSIVIVEPAADEEEKPVSSIAYVSVAQSPQQGQGYMATTEAMADPELRERVLGQAIAQLSGWKRRFGHLSELAGVVEAIEELEGVGV